MVFLSRDLSVGWRENFFKQGEPLLAYEVVSEGLKDSPQDVRLRQLQGLAPARSGGGAASVVQNWQRLG